MPTINAYLTFKDNCEEAFNFYKSVFGGDFAYLGRFGEMPPSPDGKKMPASDANKIMHVSLPISKETVLMGSDMGREWAPTFKAGNNFSISINADNKAQADTLYKKLSLGGQATMPMSDTFWGSYFGMLTDKYGINWMVSYDDPAKQMASKNKETSMQS